MGKGGWRYGAGRPGWRRKLEACLRLDIRQIACKGLLTPGTRTSWRWTNSYTGEETGSVGMKVAEGRIVLDYAVGEDRKPVQFPIYLTSTPCHYGGARPWFICPACQRNCAVVAFGRGGWACRTCLNLAYSSEAEDGMGRLWRKQRKLEARVGEDWQRPKGMHRATYERIVDRLMEIEALKDGHMMLALQRHCGASFAMA